MKERRGTRKRHKEREVDNERVITYALHCSVLTGNESPPVLDELFYLRLVHSEVPHHHSSIIAEPKYHKTLLRVTCDFGQCGVRGWMGGWMGGWVDGSVGSVGRTRA